MDDAGEVGDELDQSHHLADLARVEAIDVVDQDDDSPAIPKQRIPHDLTLACGAALVESSNLLGAASTGRRVPG